MAKKYSSDEIIRMAAGLIPEDMSADLDADGKITSADARYVFREENGKLPLDTPSLMTQNIANRIIKENSSFSYDPGADPLLSQYKKQYSEAGRRAAEDVMGRASTLTGGYGNSYGAKIASDKLSEYSALSAGKEEELEEKAYRRHKDKLDSLYSLMTDEEKKEEDRKKAALDFAVLASGMGDDSFIRELGIEPEDDDFQKLKEFAELSAKYGDYSGLQELGIDTSRIDADRDYELARLFAQYGDYSGLQALGMDISKITYGEKQELAELLAKYGDYSGLQALGVDTSRLTDKEKQSLARFFAEFGDYSKLQALGIDTSRLTDKEKQSLAELYAKYGDYSKLNDLGADTGNRELEEYYDRLLKKQKVW